MVRKSSSQQRKVGSSTSLARNFSSRFDAWLLHRLYNSLGRPQIEIKLGDGIAISPESASPIASFVIENRRTLLQIVLDPESGFGEAYTTGRVRVYGNLVTALERVFRSLQAGKTRSWYSRTVSPFLTALQRNTSQGARKNIHRHYDLDANFFRLWLDAKLVYSGAYFASSLRNLEEAQIEKMDYICHKINLQPGECVVEIGCGWGALAMHMAKYYGAMVKAFSNSHEQILWAGNRAAELGLTHKIDFIEDDYRNIRTQCDALVSVGMLEHVGAEHYREMGKVIKRVLGSTGRGLIQTVGQNQARPFNLWIRKHVFPGTYAPTLRQTMNLFEPGEFAIVDVENLRPHYARTLEHWLERFEKSSEKVEEMYGPEFVRLWRLYLAGSAASFRARSLQLFQILFAGTACQNLPFTRAQLYKGAQRVEVGEKKMYAVR